MLSHFIRKFRPPAPADTPPVKVGPLRWHLTPAGRELFGDTSPSLDRWIAAGVAVEVKRNLQRTIWRVALPGGAVYVKRCRANTPRAWGRELLRPPKARLEFENAVRLRELGVPCTEPLAWAEADSLWPGDSVVVTREYPNAVSLDQRLAEADPATGRRLAEQLGRLFAHMHRVGVAHPDPHPGNILSDGERLALVDVHAVRFGRPLAWPHARDNLVLVNRWFQVRATRADRRRFWHAYTAGWSDADAKARELEAATEASNLQFWAGRTGRYLGDNSGFRRVRAGAVRGHAVRELPDVVLQTWLTDPDAVFAQPGVKLLKDSRSSTVAVVAGGVIFKRFRLKSAFAAVKNVFRRSPALRSWVHGHNLLDRHLPTARPLFVAHRYRLGMPCEGYIAFEIVPAAAELPDAVRTADRQRLRVLAWKLGRLIRLMHDRQVSHRDLKAPNILIDGQTGNPVLIDLVGITTGRRVSDVERVRNLARLNASFAQSAQVSRTDRWRFLRAFLDPSVERNVLKSWWKGVAAATAAKVRKNLQSGRPLG
jgi:tRNA A-37 threonylcarbamoyl transferase component Bud32